MNKINPIFEALSGVDERHVPVTQGKKPLRILKPALISVAAALALAVGIRNWSGTIGSHISAADSPDRQGGALYVAPGFGESELSWIYDSFNNQKKPQTFTKNFDGVVLTVTTDKSTYGLGEPINVTATLENKSGKDINLLYGASTTDNSVELMPRFEHLIEYPIRGYVFRNDVMTIIPFKQGETCTQNFTFQTYTDYNFQGTSFSPDYNKLAEPGVHSGTLCVRTCSDMEYPYGTITDYSLDFSVTLMPSPNVSADDQNGKFITPDADGNFRFNVYPHDIVIPDSFKLDETGELRCFRDLKMSPADLFAEFGVSPLMNDNFTDGGELSVTVTSVSIEFYYTLYNKNINKYVFLDALYHTTDIGGAYGIFGDSKVISMKDGHGGIVEQNRAFFAYDGVMYTVTVGNVLGDENDYIMDVLADLEIYTPTANTN